VLSTCSGYQALSPMIIDSSYKTAILHRFFSGNELNLDFRYNFMS
jgi:hypothetical protein